MTAGPGSLDLVRTLVRGALAAEEGLPVVPVPFGPTRHRDVASVIQRHRLEPILHTHAAALGLPEQVVGFLDAWRAMARQRTLLQTLETVRARDLLVDAGVPALIFKGQALAVQTTGRTDARGPGDVDVLVAPETLGEAHRVLTGAGWALREGGRVEPDTWAWRHVRRWGNALTYVGRGADVDLHWRLEATPNAHPPFAVLSARSEEVGIGSASVATLGRYDAIRHLAAHREGWLWLRTLVDLRRLARDPEVFDGPLRPTEAMSLALARRAIGLPDGVPGRVHARLDDVPAEFLDRAAGYHARPIPPSFGGGLGSALGSRNRIAASRTVADFQQAAVALVLPAHAALPVRDRTGWTGIPRALGLRLANLARGLWSRVRPRLRCGAPCAERPGRVA